MRSIILASFQFLCAFSLFALFLILSPIVSWKSEAPDHAEWSTSSTFKEYKSMTYCTTCYGIEFIDEYGRPETYMSAGGHCARCGSSKSEIGLARRVDVYLNIDGISKLLYTYIVLHEEQ